MLKFIEILVGWLWGAPLIITILGSGIFFTYKSGFFQFRFINHIFSETLGKILRKNSDSEEQENQKSKKGTITPFQAMSTAIGGSVGVGNIGGVATAIATGGPGALFWLWVASLVGMMLKMVEVTLGVHYRSQDSKGNYYGGPTYYMEKGLGVEMNRGWWKILAFIFGGGLFSTFFITVQNYTVSEAISSTLGIGLIPASLIYVGTCYLMIMEGIKKLSQIAGKIIPFMCLFYIVAGLYIIAINFSALPDVFSLVFRSAFTGTAAVGGFTGAAFSKALRIGMARSVYSNEAGWGSSPMIHASAQTDHPIRQGLWGAVEVFIDSIVVCTVTALVILVTGAWTNGMTGATLTLTAFETGMGPVGRILLVFGIFLFGVTTSSGWYVYYEVLLRHLFKNREESKEKILKFFRFVTPLPGFLMVVAAVTVGMPGSTIWLLADLTTAVPTFVNIAVILMLSGKFFELLKDYKTNHMNISEKLEVTEEVTL